MIDEQAIEISSLKRFVFQRFDSIQESNVRNADTKKEALENLFSARKTINKLSRNELSTVNEDSKLGRYHGKEEVADYHNFQSPTLKKRQVSSIAFSVFLSHDADLGGDQIVKFDKIITNEGNGYNVHSGAFTCPEGGIYLFSYFVGESNVRGIWLNLKVNSVNIIDAAVDTFNPSQDLQGGNTVVLRLKTGDVVVIESRGGHVEGSDSIRLTSFSGVLLSF